MRCHRGFTLIELLLAIAMTGVVGMMAYAGLDAAIRANDGVTKQAERIQEINLTMTIIARDLRQAQARAILNENDEYETAFHGSGAADEAIVLTRSGWQNPTGRNRSKLQRVAYHFRDGRLLRESWDVLDRFYGENSYTATLLEGVEDFTARFLAPVLDEDADVFEESEWLDEWNPELGNEDNAFLPMAAEISFSLEGWGDIRRIYMISSYWPLQGDFRRISSQGGRSARERRR